MSRFIIIIERDENTVFPITDGTPGREDCTAIFPSQESAEQAADNTMACRAWNYCILNLDE